MKKVLLITHDYSPNSGGVAHYLAGIYSRYPKDQLVLLLDKSLQQKNRDVKSYYKTFWAKWMYPRWIPLFFAVLRLVKKEQITEVHVSHVFPLGTLAYFIWKIRKIPYRVYFHGMDIAIARRKQYKRGLLRKIITHAQSIVVNSEFTKGLVQGEVAREDVVVWYPRVSAMEEVHEAAIESFKQRYALHSKWVMLSLARLVKRKGIDDVLVALKDVVKINPSVVYIIAGDGPELHHLQKTVQEFDLQNTVRFVGKVDEEDKQIWLALAQCFIMSTKNADPDVEGFGIVYLEAAQHGVPSIASSAGGAPEAVIHNQTGIVVPPNNTQALAKAIALMISDEPLRVRLGEQAKARAAELTWNSETLPQELL